MTKIGHWAAALTKWTLAGFPTRSDDEVAAIYRDHCQPCEEFDAKAKACKLCGCNVRRDGMAVANKIRMATEVCPLGKW